MPASFPITASLEDKLAAAYHPLHLEVVNESHMHASGLGAESHFKVLMVSTHFEGITKVQRQRDVFATLAHEMKSIHALSLRLLTPLEWEQAQTNFASPLCHSKAKN